MWVFVRRWCRVGLVILGGRIDFCSTGVELDWGAGWESVSVLRTSGGLVASVCEDV